jgi:MFS family permease
MGVGMGFFWPPVQAHLADLAGADRLAGALGRFNVAWSLGKGLGFFGAGALVNVFAPLGERGSYTTCLLVGAVLALLPVLLLEGSGLRREGREEEEGTGAHRPGATTHRRLAWIANFYLYGTAAVLVAHHPNWVREMNLVEWHSLVFLGAVFLSQTLAFIFWSGYGRWRYRLGEFLLVQVAFVLVVALLPLPGRFVFTMILAPILGLGLGLGYQASLYYSLHVKAGRGRLSGLHEGILGSGGFLMPPVAGLLATWTRDVSVTYLLAAAVGAAALLLQTTLARPGGGHPDIRTRGGAP